MTPQEQAQVEAAIQYLEKQVANVAREGANKASLAEMYAQQLKEAQDKIAKLEEAAKNKDHVELRAVEA